MANPVKLATKNTPSLIECDRFVAGPYRRSSASCDLSGWPTRPHFAVISHYVFCLPKRSCRDELIVGANIINVLPPRVWRSRLCQRPDMAALACSWQANRTAFLR